MQIKYFGHGCGQSIALSQKRVFLIKMIMLCTFLFTIVIVIRHKCYGENICSKLYCLVYGFGYSYAESMSKPNRFRQIFSFPLMSKFDSWIKMYTKKSRYHSRAIIHSDLITYFLTFDFEGQSVI